MTEETRVTVQPQTNGLAPWGSRGEVKEIADRLKRFVPGTKKMNDTEIMAFAQLVHMTGLNPCQNELFGWDSKGDGSGVLITKLYYGLLVRWAMSQEPFTTRFTTKTDPESEDIISQCRLLRQSDRPLLGQLLSNDVDYQEALSWATTVGLGVVTKKERWSKRYNKLIDPPKSKSWPWKAEKRALEDAIRRGYGVPSTKELARQTWIVEDTLTIPEDWKGVTPEMLPAEREATARFSARQRLSPPVEETAAESIDLLFGPAMGDAALSEKPPEPETEWIAENPPPAPPEMPQGSPSNGLDGLLEDVNVILCEKVLDTYNHVNHVKNALKQLGYASYKPTLHQEMLEKLVERRGPPPSIPVGDVKNEVEFWVAVLANLKLGRDAALALLGVSSYVEIPGTTLDAKYGTVVLAQRKAAL